MKRSFSSKDKLFWKSIETECIFTKREMNNEWNVDFLHNTSCVEKVSRLKLYLPREKWTMNEALIFFKDELCWKSIETEGVFTKTAKNNYQNEIFIHSNINGQWIKS